TPTPPPPCISTLADDSNGPLPHSSGKRASPSGDPVPGQAGPRSRALDRDRPCPPPRPPVAPAGGALAQKDGEPAGFGGLERARGHREVGRGGEAGDKPVSLAVQPGAGPH